MNNNTSASDITAAEAALTAAGISYTVVATCGNGGCPWCCTTSLPAAA